MVEAAVVARALVVAAVVVGELVVALDVTGALVVAGPLVEAAVVVAELRPEIAALIRGYFPKYVKYIVSSGFEGHLGFSILFFFTAAKKMFLMKNRNFCVEINIH